MKLSGLMALRLRGFRVVDLAALVIFLALALAVYAFKTSAGAQRADIADMQDQIREERSQVRRLQAVVAHLESPARLERLATQYEGLAPITARQEITPEDLPRVAAGGPPS